MASKKAPVGPGAADGEAIRELLSTVEQVLAAGWYPARRRLLEQLASVPGREVPAWVPEADVEETPREIVVTVALPGVEKADIRVNVESDMLTVRGRRREAATPHELPRRERPSGEFLRRVPLPDDVKPGGATALYRNGVLRVILPRARASFGRAVKVD